MAKQWKRMASVAYGFSLARLTLNACGAVEMEKSRMSLIEDVTGQMERFLEGTLEEEPVASLREKLRGEMEMLLAFLDQIHIYSSVLYSQDYRFNPRPELADVDDKYIVSLMMRFLISGEDTAAVNERIKMLLGLLPVRLTRKKFYSMVRDSLSVYIGADMAGLKRNEYFLRGASGLELTPERRNRRPELSALLEDLDLENPKEMTREQYDHLEKELTEALQRITDEMEACSLLGQMANDLYVLCLCGPDAVRDAVQEENSRAILGEVISLNRQGKEELPDSLVERLCSLEGLQEEYDEKYQRLNLNLESESGEPWVKKARMVDLLLSASDFASLEELEPDEAAAADKDVDLIMETYIRQMDRLFASCSKPVMRAIMAQCLARIPISFCSLDEIEEYFKRSLSSCTDLVERNSCVSQIVQMMESEGYELV